MKKWYNNETKQELDSNKAEAIAAWKILCWWCIWVFILMWFVFLGFIKVEEGLSNLISFVFMFLIIMWCRISYKYILKIKTHNLHFKSLWWPTWWWVCPIVNLIVPYLSVLDIYKTHIQKWWIGIVISRWWCCLGRLLRVLIKWEIWYRLWLILEIVRIILTMIIVKKIEKSLNSTKLDNSLNNS